MSETLESEDYFMGNHLNLEFQTDVKVWDTDAVICLNVTLRDPNRSCPYPNFRARLSGAAIVNIRLGGGSVELHNYFNPRGCALFPVPGTYYLDVVLLHCTMNAVPRDVSSAMLKQSCPVKPKSRAVLNYTLIVGQFERDDSVVSQLWPQRNPFPRRSFVFSPVCPGEDYMVGPHCNLSFERAKNPQPPMLRVDTQPALHVPNAEKTVILRDYVYLEVDPRNGDLNYNATYNLYNYARPPKDFESDEIVCFLGDSHARFTWYQAKVIVQDRAINKTGCDDWSYHSSQDYNLTGQFRFMLMKFADDFLSSESKLKAGMFEECSMVVILYGHWDGVSSLRSPGSVRACACRHSQGENNCKRAPYTVP